MRFEIHKSGKRCYVLQVARNGEILNTSETFNEYSSALKNIKSVYNGFNSLYRIKKVDLVNQRFNFLLLDSSIVKSNWKKIPTKKK